MQKIIKLSDIHYIIIDDSEIKEGDYYRFNVGYASGIKQATKRDIEQLDFEIEPKKITHSTQPLEQYYGATDGSIPFVYHKIKKLSLSEVEKVVNGYSVENIVKEYVQELIDCKSVKESERTWISAICHQIFIKAHQELVKDKLFITDKNLFDFLYFAKTHSQYSDKAIVEEFKQSLLPKTEWNIEFDEQSKIKLI